MRSFITTILSLMLGWIRAIITRLWALINSDSGDAMYRFFSAHWLQLAAALCIVGIAADLIIYFFRWRPDYVWRSRLHRRRPQPAAPAPQAHDETQVYRPVNVPVYAPLHERGMVCDPTTDRTQTYAPVQEAEPVFDEDAFLWEDDGPVMPDWQPEETPAFGAPRPEPATLYHDIQAGFAPAVPPQQLYTPSASYLSPHPGLNEDAMRQTFGLQTDEEAVQERAVPVVQSPGFRPFTVREGQEQQTPTRLSRLARRARTFVSMEDEDRPTIHDLQSTVDVAQAFHEPVYPQPIDKGRYNA